MNFFRILRNTVISFVIFGGVGFAAGAVTGFQTYEKVSPVLKKAEAIANIPGVQFLKGGQDD